MAGTKTFNGKPIRAEYAAAKKEWLFSAVDFVSALTDVKSYNQARKNWSVIKLRANGQLTSNCSQLKLESADGKKYNSDVLNRNTALKRNLQKYWGNKTNATNGSVGR